MSLGYCNTHVVTTDSSHLNPSDTNRHLLDSDLPSRFKFLGFSFNPIGKYVTALSANTIETFQLYDGDSDDGLILTFPVVIGVQSFTSNGSDFIVQNDSYIPIESGLYYKVSNADLISTDNPVSTTLIYV